MTVFIKQNVLMGWRVLVVDDEPDSVEVARMLLEQYGAEVLTADNGEAGFEIARTRLPVFIISDLSMPQMSGWEMLTRLKTEHATADIPVIALTAHAMAGDRKNAIMAGFHNYLTKPLEPETFVHDLLNLLVDVPAIARKLDEGAQ